MTERMRVFDRRLVRLRRERFARELARAGFLVEEVGDRLRERLEDIRRPLRRVLLLGAPRGLLEGALAGRTGTELVVAVDETAAMLTNGHGLRVVADAEALPFGPGRFDAVLSLMHLHWVNDLPGTLVQLRSCLAEDGLLLLALPGGETLIELRQALMQAELECEGGASPRVSPFADARDAGALLQRAGLALPVVDVDRITVSYADPLRLLRELGRMGEGNALLQRRPGPLRASHVGPCLRAVPGAVRRRRREGAGDLRHPVPDRLEAAREPAQAPGAGLGQAAAGRGAPRSRRPQG